MALPDTNFDIDKGMTFSFGAKLLDASKVPIDITGYTAIMKVRTHPDDKSNVLAQYSTASGHITLPTPANGQFIVTLQSTDTESITWRSGYYDLVVISPAGTPVYTRIVKGQLNVNLVVST